MSEQLNKMQFKIAVSNPTESHFSLDKKDADFSHNQIILNSIIGTLVKYGLSGRLEPYLAESWTVSRDKKLWKFTLKSNLQAEDGTLITAELFKKILTQSLKDYSLNGSAIMFDHLTGWKEFVSGKSNEIVGLTSKENIISMQFDENPDDLLELLRMPYFGLWIEKNNTLISTGPYSLKKIDKGTITLSLRKNWFTASENSFKEVHIGFAGLNDNNDSLPSNSIIRMPFFIKTNEKQKNAYWISSLPTRLETFVLSATKNNFFNKIENRITFRNKVLAQYPGLVRSRYFYQSARTENLPTSDTDYIPQPKTEKLQFALERITYSEEESANLQKIISNALSGANVEFEIIPRDQKDKEWFTKTDSNHYFDSRIASVDIGAYPDYFVVKMMFCTKLGVNFPDPTGKMCELVLNGIRNQLPIDQTFVDNFNTILHNESVIIPILHHSDKWLVSNNFDPTSLPATTIYPQFEMIRLR